MLEIEQEESKEKLRLDEEKKEQKREQQRERKIKHRLFGKQGMSGQKKKSLVSRAPPHCIFICRICHFKQ